MSRRIVVGYTANAAGADAVAVAARFARAIDAELLLVIVLPADDRSVITPPSAGYDRHLLAQADAWLEQARTLVPAGIAADGRVVTAESFAEGLSEVASETAAELIVVGAANGGLRGRHRLGTVATALLHSSDVAVALAPAGSASVTTPITRVTAAIGTRPGAQRLLDEAVDLAGAAGVQLRLLSLITVDLPASVNTGAIRIASGAHAEHVLMQAGEQLPDGLVSDVIAARGESIEDAVKHLDWQDGEIVMVGSSRLAQPRRLFLGSTAAKMLHELTIPMVVVPRTTADDTESNAKERAND